MPAVGNSHVLPRKSLPGSMSNASSEKQIRSTLCSIHSTVSRPTIMAASIYKLLCSCLVVGSVSYKVGSTDTDLAYAKEELSAESVARLALTRGLITSNMHKALTNSSCLLQAAHLAGLEWKEFHAKAHIKKVALELTEVVHKGGAGQSHLGASFPNSCL